MSQLNQLRKTKKVEEVVVAEEEDVLVDPFSFWSSSDVRKLFGAQETDQDASVTLRRKIEMLKLINHHKKDGYKLIIDGGDASNECTAADIARLKEPSQTIPLLAYKTCLRLMGNEGHASFASCIQDVSVIFEGRDQPGHTLGDGSLLELEFPTTTGAVASPTRAASSKEPSQPSPI